MKRNGIVLTTILAMLFIAGQVFGAGFPVTAASPQDVSGEIDGSSPFQIDIYMANESGIDVTGFGASFGFYSPDGSIETITHVDVGGDGEMPSVQYLNSYMSYFALGLHVDGATYMDGTLPDYVNFTAAGITGMPAALTTPTAFIRFNIQIDNSTTGTTGQFCIDSIGSTEIGGSTDWDWLFSPEYSPASFNGPYCWTITNLSGSDVNLIDEDKVLPDDFELGQNYPNPFNPSTHFEFALPQKSQVNISIYNVLGQKVKTLADSEYAAGRYVVDWDGTDDHGSTAASGIYFYKMSADNFQATKKLMLLK